MEEKLFLFSLTSHWPNLLCLTSINQKEKKEKKKKIEKERKVIKQVIDGQQTTVQQEPSFVVISADGRRRASARAIVMPTPLAPYSSFVVIDTPVLVVAAAAPF